jgi:hypothetical protein
MEMAREQSGVLRGSRLRIVFVAVDPDKVRGEPHASSVNGHRASWSLKHFREKFPIRKCNDVTREDIQPFGQAPAQRHGDLGRWLVARVGHALEPWETRCHALVDVLDFHKIINTEEKRCGVEALGAEMVGRLSYYVGSWPFAISCSARASSTPDGQARKLDACRRAALRTVPRARARRDPAGGRDRTEQALRVWDGCGNDICLEAPCRFVSTTRASPM